jgi:ribonuclease Z
VEYDGQIYGPELVMGAPRKGIKLTYCTDTRPAKSLVQFARDSDLAIFEGMYAEPDKLEKAKQYKHMTFYEAAHVARDAKVRELWLTHFSPSLVRGEDYMDKVRGIFPHASLGKDGRMTELDFEEEAQ